VKNSMSDVILRVVGRVNGVRPYEWLDFLETSQFWPRERVLEFQRRELGEILEFARTEVPHFGDVLPASRVREASKDLAALAHIPLMKKDILREQFERLQPRGKKPRRQDVSTSGSTGKPLRMLIDNAAFARCFAAKFRALRWHGVNFADRQLRVWGRMMRKDQEVYWRVRDVLQNRRRMVSFDLSDQTLTKAYEDLVRFRPTYINGYTSAIQRFADFIEKSGRDGKALGSRLVVPTAEMLYDWQAEQMQRVFGCPVMNEYGSVEVTALAYQCPAGNMHISHENWLVEALDEQGNAVPDGEEGLLTVTSLCFRAIPLIRYQNGDMIVKNKELFCECGRHPGLASLARIVGRSTDVLLRADGQTTHWTTMYYAIKDAFVPGMILEHQARQKAIDRIVIQVVKGPKYSERAMERFLARMRGVLGENMRLELDFVDHIPREASGKHRYFVSDIAAAKLSAAGGGVAQSG
jgi:phenylacetate-CoA ligase